MDTIPWATHGGPQRPVVDLGAGTEQSEALTKLDLRPNRTRPDLTRFPAALAETTEPEQQNMAAGLFIGRAAAAATRNLQTAGPEREGRAVLHCVRVDCNCVAQREEGRGETGSRDQGDSTFLHPSHPVFTVHKQGRITVHLLRRHGNTDLTLVVTGNLGRLLGRPAGGAPQESLVPDQSDWRTLTVLRQAEDIHPFLQVQLHPVQKHLLLQSFFPVPSPSLQTSNHEELTLSQFLLLTHQTAETGAPCHFPPTNIWTTDPSDHSPCPHCVMVHPGDVKPPQAKLHVTSDSSMPLLIRTDTRDNMEVDCRDVLTMMMTVCAEREGKSASQRPFLCQPAAFWFISSTEDQDS
ncbi:hypothetical protein CRENBAI_008944 [Crenichthys baileyi]|uniref:Uncharacterized protein n=1 Tax=Crenichthys baileyi TaxID=28760 RepID=A0AAV9R6H1_9TELE